MNDRDEMKFLEDWRSDSKESIDYFSEANKARRERQVCAQFLKILGVDFTSGEVVSRAGDPPDVIFRDARFEVKEILDPGRRRHDEIKQGAAKLEAARRLTEVLKFTAVPAENADTAKIGTLIWGKSEELVSNKYVEAALRASLDLLFYVNRRGLRLLDDGPMPDAQAFEELGFRSISALVGRVALVFCASGRAPGFLREKVGTTTRRMVDWSDT